MQICPALPACSVSCRPGTVWVSADFRLWMCLSQATSVSPPSHCIWILVFIPARLSRRFLTAGPAWLDCTDRIRVKKHTDFYGKFKLTSSTDLICFWAEAVLVFALYTHHQNPPPTLTFLSCFSWDWVLSKSVLTCSDLTTGSWETAEKS